MSWRKIVLSLVTTLVLLATAAVPLTAHAQEPLPPPDGTVTEEIPAPDGAVTEEAPPTDELPAEEAPIADEVATAEAPALVEPVVEEVTLPEVLQAAPEGTEVVVLDENGEALPLASTAAAEALLVGDPIWCPDGAAPSAGSGGCTGTHATLEELVATLSSSQPTKNGTIWILNGPDLSTSAISLDGSTLSTWSDYSLVLRGGWDGSAAGTIIGESTFSVPLEIINWGGDITLNDLVFDGAGGSPTLQLETEAGDIILDDVVVKNNISGGGAELAASGAITVTNSDFSDNDGPGLLAGGGLEDDPEHGKDVTLTNVTANDNDSVGVAVGSVYGAVTLTNVTGHEDGEVGVAAGSVYGPVTLNGIYSDASYVGVVGGSVFGDVTIQNVETYDHFLGTLGVSIFGDTSLSNVTSEDGAVGTLALGLGDVSLTQIYADYNDYVGVAALTLGGIELVNTFGLEEDDFDFFPYVLGEDFGSDLFEALTTAGSTPGTITLNTIEANHGNGIGVVAAGIGDTSLTNVNANDNAFAGVIDVSVGQTLAEWLRAYAVWLMNDPEPGTYPDPNAITAATGGAGNTTLTNVTTNGNGFVGTLALVGGSASLTGVTANDNGLLGVAAISLGGLPLPTEDGPLTWPVDGSTTLTGVDASGNGLIGAAAVAPGDVYVGNSSFNENGFLGLAAISLEDGNVTVYKVYALDNGVDVNLPLMGSVPFGSMGMGMGVLMGSLTVDLEPLSEWFIAGPYVPFFPIINPSETGGSNLICSVSTGNSGYGLGAISNTVISSSVLSPNGMGDSTEMGGEATVGPDVNCAACEGEECNEGRDGLLLIPATGCGNTTLSEGGVTAVLHNLCGHEVMLESVSESDLPGTLPSGATLSLGGVIVAPDLPLPDHSITLHFPVPSGADPASLAVLFWNGSEWIEVPDGTVVDGMFVVTVTEGGIYVLVQR